MQLVMIFTSQSDEVTTGVDARPIAAQVVNLVTIGQPAIEILVGASMRRAAPRTHAVTVAHVLRG
jgi:hypothetical protein